MELVPCDVERHPGLGLGSETLAMTLEAVGVPWLTREVCRAFRDRGPPGPYAASDVVRSVAGLERAIALGMRTISIGSWIAETAPIEVVEWAHRRRLLGKRACNWAARGGRVDALAWLVGHWYHADDQTCACAALGGHTGVLEWLRAHHYPWTVHTGCAAASHGHLETLMWAHAHACPIDARTCEAAAGGGHLAVLKWLRGVGCAWNHDTTSRAAYGGHMDVLEWATQEGCPRSVAAGYYAAGQGRLNVVRWLRDHAYEWDTNTARYAEMSGRLDVLDWMLAHGCPPAEHASTMGAAMGGSIEMLEWRDRQGHDWTRDRDASIGAGMGGDARVFEWLEARGALDTATAASAAAHSGCGKALDWLDARGHVGNPATLLASGAGHMAAVDWLVARGYELDAESCIESIARMSERLREHRARNPGLPYEHDRWDHDAVARWLRTLAAHDN